MCQCFCFSAGKPAISLRLKWHILSTLQKENNRGRTSKHPRARQRAAAGSLRAFKTTFCFSLSSEAEKSLRTHFMIFPQGPKEVLCWKHHACRERSLDHHYLSDIRLLLVAGLLQWAVMNCWLCSETEINPPAVGHASVCSAHTSIISGDCLSDGSVYASTPCSPRPEVSGDLKIHEHKRRRSLEDTVAQTATRRQSRTVPEDCLRTCLLEGWKDLQSYFWTRESTYVEHNSVSRLSLELVSSNDEMRINVHSVQRGFNGTDHLQSHVQFEGENLQTQNLSFSV